MKYNFNKIALAFALAVCAVQVKAQSTDKSKPNIVFVMADDLGYGELGCYGNTFNETPNLDKLAKQSMLFTQGYSAAPICSPSRAAILTGQFPARLRLTDFLPAHTNRWIDPAKYYTLNEALGSGGYHTGIIGKWHLDTDYKTMKGSPKAHGFDEVIASETKYIADGDYFFPYDKIATITDGTPDEYLTDRQCDEASKFIKRNKDKPFFLYLTFYSVHTKLDAPKSVVDKYKAKFDARYGNGEAEKVFGASNPSHTANHKDNPYLAAMLERIDAGVGNVLKTLDETGLADNTIFVFFSDNGGAGKAGNNTPLRAGKSWLYEGGIREPMIVRWPGKIKAGLRSDEPVCAIDFYPTFIDAAGINVNGKEKLDGISLLPLLTQGKKPERDELYWHYPAETMHWKNRMASAVRKGDYKLIYFYRDDKYELYDVKNDVAETRDLASTLPDKVKELRKLLDSWKKDVHAEQPDLNAKTNNGEGG